MSGQNRSSAVMQQRKSPLDALDYFPTPPWATRALCEWIARRMDIGALSVAEPACGEGHMARALAEFFASVDASDIHDYGAGYRVADFLHQPLFDCGEAGERRHWLITNPPFNLSIEFVMRAFDVATKGVAMIARTSWLESEDRYNPLFSKAEVRPTIWLQFVERVLMLERRLVRPGAIDPKTGKPASTATSYGWAVWLFDQDGCVLRPNDIVFSALDWIAPCRLRLERPGDYPIYPEGAFA